MKLTLVHLSDVHIDSSMKESILNRIKKITRAVQSISQGISHALILFTGDFVFSGENIQFIQGKDFVKILYKELRKDFKTVKFYIVPGNHDLLIKDSKLREELIEKTDKENYYSDDEINELLQPLNNFFHFAKQLDGKNHFKSSDIRLYNREIITVEDKKIVINQVNSTLKYNLDKNQGELIFPIKIIDNIKNIPDTDLSITILHHPFNWFQADNSRILNQKIRECSDIILTGHEHNVDSFIHIDSENEVNYISGGELQSHKGSCKESEFNVIISDFTEEINEVYKFYWDSNGDLYKYRDMPFKTIFLRNRGRKRHEIDISEKFSRDLDEPGIIIKHPRKQNVTMTDIFIFPRFELVDCGDLEKAHYYEIDDLEKQGLFDNSYIIFSGPSNSGKTSLSKMIFKRLFGLNKLPILLNGSDIKRVKDGSIRRIITKYFESEYKDSDIQIFLQKELDEKFIIIDDFDESKINDNNYNDFIECLLEYFGHIIIISEETPFLFNLNPIQLSLNKYIRLRIKEFGKVKTNELIMKWVRLGQEEEMSSTALIDETDEKLRIIQEIITKRYIPSYPFYLITLLQLIEGSSYRTHNDSLLDFVNTGTIGFFYDALVRIAFSKSIGPDVETELKFTYLSHLAHTIFITGNIREIDVREWHNKYCALYALNLPYTELIDSFIEASIMEKSEDCLIFKYPYLYYYFIAKFFADNIYDKEIKREIMDLIQQLDNKENSDIILFLSFLSKDKFIYESILSFSENILEDYQEMNLDEKSKIFDKLITTPFRMQLNNESPIHERRRAALFIADEIDEISKDDETDKDNNINEKSNKDDKIAKKRKKTISVAYRSIEIVGQILKNHSGSLIGSVKMDLVQYSYVSGSKILNLILSNFIKDKDDMVVYLLKRIDEAESDFSMVPEEDKISIINNFILNLAALFVISIMRYVSKSLGHENLQPIFEKLNQQSDDLYFELQDLIIYMTERFHGFPKRKILDIWKKIQRDEFIKLILRYLVWNYFYLYPVDYKIIDEICSKLEIIIKPSPQIPDNLSS
ncbi:MAG: metallophosphoesterase [Eubacteriaceae bacterium]